MRSFFVLGISALAAACTNDYDALLDQAGGGGPTGSTVTGGAASSGDASAGSSTTTQASSASTGDGTTGSGGSGGGDGGAGGGDGGSGGAGEAGGAGGEGGSAPPTFCERLGLDLEDDLVVIEEAGIWQPYGNEDVALEVDTDDHELVVGFSTLDAAQGGGLRASATREDLGDCALTATIVDFPEPSALQDTIAAGYLGLSGVQDRLIFYVGLIRLRNTSDLTQLAIQWFDPTAPNPTTGGTGNFVNVVEPIIGEVELPVGLRLITRGATNAVSVEISKGGGPFEAITDFDLTRLPEPYGAVEFSALRFSGQGVGQAFDVGFGPFDAKD